MASLFSKALRRPHNLFVQSKWSWRAPAAIRAASTRDVDQTSALKHEREPATTAPIRDVEHNTEIKQEGDAVASAVDPEPALEAGEDPIAFAANEKRKQKRERSRILRAFAKAAIPEAPFTLGEKKLYLPNDRIALLKTPQHPPNFAKFLVPLNWNKLDLRDYLWNAYSVHALRVRVYVQLQRVRMDKPSARFPATRRWFRPQSKKFMTIEMDEPFYWPADPENTAAWDKETFDAANKNQTKERDSRMPLAAMQKPDGAGDLRAMAQKYMSGSEKWTPPTQAFAPNRFSKR